MFQVCRRILLPRSTLVRKFSNQWKNNSAGKQFIKRIFDNRRVELTVRSGDISIHTDSFSPISRELVNNSVSFHEWSIRNESMFSKKLFTAKRYPYWPIIDTFHFYLPTNNICDKSKTSKENSTNQVYLKNLLVDVGDKLYLGQKVATRVTENSEMIETIDLIPSQNVDENMERMKYRKENEYRKASTIGGGLLGFAYGIQAFIISVAFGYDADLTLGLFPIIGTIISTVFPYYRFPFLLFLQIAILIILPIYLISAFIVYYLEHYPNF
jgi:hypothetical protein